MSFIETIEIKNFKSIRHQKIEGCKRINVFIGYPNVGKSNILEALSLFSINESSPPLFSSFVRMENLTTLFFNGNIEEKFEVRLNNNHRYIAEINVDYLRFERQYTKDTSLFEYGRFSEKSLTNEFTIDLVKSFGLRENNKSITDYFPFSFESTIGTMLPEIKKYSFKKDIAFLPIRYDYLSFPFGENIFAIISGHPKIKKEIENLFLVYNLELLFDTRERKFAILKRTSSGIFSIPYELLADTLQRLIFYKAAILSNTESILLFEEPEAHMFPPYMRKFTSDVIGDKTNQFFIATHSPYILDSFIEDAPNDLAVFLVDYKNGETIIVNLSADDILEIREYGVDLFFNLESYLKHGKINND